MEEGEKKDETTNIALLQIFIEQYRAGSPTQQGVYWISIKPNALSKLFSEQNGVKISHGFIKRELKALGYRYRKISKNIATDTYAQRDTQFQIIFEILLAMSMESPILSIDCKKKEQLGTLYRQGKKLLYRAERGIRPRLFLLRRRANYTTQHL